MVVLWDKYRLAARLKIEHCIFLLTHLPPATMQTIQHSFEQLPKWAQFGYTFMVASGAAYGALHGMKAFCQWYSTDRQKVKMTLPPAVNADVANALVNAGRDAGFLASYVVGSAAFATIVWSCPPVTIPVMLLFSKPDNE